MTEYILNHPKSKSILSIATYKNFISIYKKNQADKSQNHLKLFDRQTSLYSKYLKCQISNPLTENYKYYTYKSNFQEKEKGLKRNSKRRIELFTRRSFDLSRNFIGKVEWISKQQLRSTSSFNLEPF